MNRLAITSLVLRPDRRLGVVQPDESAFAQNYDLLKQ